MHIIWVGLLMAGIALALQQWAIKTGLHWQTIVFNFICLSQMGHAMAIRSDNESVFTIGLFSNKLMITSVITVFLLQLAITYIPFLNPVFHTEALGFSEFILTGAASSLIFFAVEVEKKTRRRNSTI
ncbi:MAG: cation transporting ATPase C-terminal domain-containing protein [Bacteroidota bacterium]